MNMERGAEGGSLAGAQCVIRPLERRDNVRMAAIIRRVSAEFGLTAEAGYAVGDPQLDDLAAAFSGPGVRYWVLDHGGEVYGGGGIGRLAGGDGSVCELQKMYFLPECRGQGLGRRLVGTALDFARGQGYAACYLETTGNLTGATALYRKLGFLPCLEPLGDTGHAGCCELRFILPLA